MSAEPAPWNTFVEGDNLDVLATLPAGSADLVYIDPPYNTGNDFAYRDDFRGKRGAGARGRHAAWVEFMRPRLEAGHRVLAETGALFVSIDDHEVAHLRLLLDEVHGEDAFLAQVVVNLNAKGRQAGQGFRHLPRVRPRLRQGPRALRARRHHRDDRGRGGLPARGRGRTPLPSPAAAQHQQEVQPADRAHPALPGVRRPGVRPRRDRALRRLGGGQAGLRRRSARGLALVAAADGRAARRPGVPAGARARWRAGGRLPARLAAPGGRAPQEACAPSGSPRRSARPTPRSPVQGPARARLRVAEADRSAPPDPGDHARGRAGPRLLRGQRDHRSRGGTGERRRRRASYLPLGERPRAHPGRLERRAGGLRHGLGDHPGAAAGRRRAGRRRLPRAQPDAGRALQGCESRRRGR
ncbi:DNA methyltransferase [Nocardioides convexus]|uniref:DNA methyltransferase n=1 Tax=Nocardioides convexus TaxID=2712224 RepID=UPI00241889F2|nr:DNA methyltransferase [Nocardioides convexus]